MKKLLIVLPALMMFLFFLITCNKHEISKNNDSFPNPSVVSNKQFESFIVADSIKPFTAEGSNFKFYYIYSDTNCFWGWDENEISLPSDVNVFISTVNSKVVKSIKLPDLKNLDYFTKGFLLNLSMTNNRQSAFNMTFERIKT